MANGAVQLSIVLPCYNEARSLPALLESYRKVWKDFPTELVLVNNGSTDDTASVLSSLLARPEYSFARMITVEKNRGYGHGIMTGLRAAQGKILAFSHADLQCRAEDVFAGYDALVRSGTPEQTVIKGRRAKRGWQASLITNGMTVIASSLLCQRLSDINAQPKVFCREHLDLLTSPPDGFEFDVYVLFKARQQGKRVETIPVQFLDRAHGTSKWAFSFRSRWRTMLRVFQYILALRLGTAG